MKKALNVITRLALAAVIIFVAYWFALPAINLVNTGFWGFLIFCIAVITVLFLPKGVFAGFSVETKGTQAHVKYNGSFKENVKKAGLLLKISGGAIGLIVVFLLVGGVMGWEIFNATAYRDLLTVTDGDFATDVAELNMSQIPVVDRDTAARLGSRKLGEMSDLVSQFDISDDYTQINYNGSPYRVTPLAYADIIKLAYNYKDGLPGYITVDMVTQETSLVRFENGGMKYSRSDVLLRDIDRHLRFNYPTLIFDEISFEIDDNGTPYWVASVVDYRIGIWSGADISGVVLCNAMNGDCEYYDIKDTPQWVDQAYSSDMIVQQLIYNGEYVSGFWNSVFGQRDVLQPTDGYNYIAVDDDVWLYTGMTSVLADESNVGFVLVNLRTKETKFYSVPGAEEYSAMSSAQGQVQHLGYVSTFPILLNVADRPTYFMALKDGAGLSKMYAFVDVEQYQVVATGYTVSEARDNYSEKLAADENIVTRPDEDELVEGVISEITSAVVNGNTKYYIKLQNDGRIFIADVSLNDGLPFAKVNDEIYITVDARGNVIHVATEKATAYSSGN